MTNLAYQMLGIGHNAGGDAFDAIKARADQLAATANEWLANVQEIADQETAESCDSFLAQVRAELKAADKERKAINEPHDKEIKANNERFRGVTALLQKCDEMLSPLKARWLQRERDRIARERAEAEAAAQRALEEAEAARRAAEAAAAPTVQAAMAEEQASARVDAALAALDAAERAKPQVKGGLAARASGLRQYWYAEIQDWPKAVLHFEEDPRVREVVQALANAEARASKEQMKVAGAVAKMEERA